MNIKRFNLHQHWHKLFGVIVLCVVVYSGYAGLHRMDLNRELCLAVNHEDSREVRRLLAAGADPNTRLPWYPWNSWNNIKEGLTYKMPSVLEIAAWEPHSTDIVAALIAYHANVNSSEGMGGTPVLSAIGGGNAATLRILFANGAKLRDLARNCDGPQLVFDHACVSQIITSDGDYLGVIKALVDRGLNVNALGMNGDTMLTIACWYNDATMVRFLLDHRAHPQLADRNGKTPLMYAQMRGNKVIIHLLKEAMKQSPKSY